MFIILRRVFFFKGINAKSEILKRNERSKGGKRKGKEEEEKERGRERGKGNWK